MNDNEAQRAFLKMYDRSRGRDTGRAPTYEEFAGEVALAEEEASRGTRFYEAVRYARGRFGKAKSEGSA